MNLAENSDITEQTKRLMDGRGFDFVVNMVGGSTFGPAIKSLNAYGQMACIASPGQPVIELNLLDFYRRNLSLFGVNTALDGVVESASKLKALMQEFKADVTQLACLGETQIVSFAEARVVMEKALAKQYRKPVFRMSKK
jgi:NADPH:quinone reductase